MRKQHQYPPTSAWREKANIDWGAEWLRSLESGEQSPNNTDAGSHPFFLLLALHLELAQIKKNETTGQQSKIVLCMRLYTLICKR